MDVGATPEDPATWTMFWARIWRGGSPSLQGKAALDEVRKRTKDFCEPFQSAIDWTPEGTPCNVDEMGYWVPVPWEKLKGRVTLAGDAAHPMLPCEFPAFRPFRYSTRHCPCRKIPLVYVANQLTRHWEDRGQGLNHSINDAENLLDAMLKIRDDPSKREEILAAYDAEMVERGAKAVQQSLKEAEFSLDLSTVEKMIWATKGFAKTE
jgi:hypothetical protein